MRSTFSWGKLSNCGTNLVKLLNLDEFDKLLTARQFCITALLSPNPKHMEHEISCKTTQYARKIKSSGFQNPMQNAVPNCPKICHMLFHRISNPHNLNGAKNQIPWFKFIVKTRHQPFDELNLFDKRQRSYMNIMNCLFGLDLNTLYVLTFGGRFHVNALNLLCRCSIFIVIKGEP